MSSIGCHGNIEVVPLSLYIASEWCAHINSLTGLYESLMAAKQTKLIEKESDEGFTEYISLDDIRGGVSEVSLLYDNHFVP